jgi:hypothetical protein
MVHAGRIRTVEAANPTFRICDGDHLLTEAHRTMSRISPGSKSASQNQRDELDLNGQPPTAWGWRLGVSVQ